MLLIIVYDIYFLLGLHVSCYSGAAPLIVPFHFSSFASFYRLKHISFL
jgi:hypothetical protein